VKYYHLTVGAQGEAKWAKVAKKSSTYDVTHKKPAPLSKKIFFECRLEDVLRLLTLRPGPYPEQERRYS